MCVQSVGIAYSAGVSVAAVPRIALIRFSSSGVRIPGVTDAKTAQPLIADASRKSKFSSFETFGVNAAQSGSTE